MPTRYEIRPIGYVESPLVDRDTAPKQGFEGAPEAWLVFDPQVAEGIRDLTAGAEVFVMTWLHQAQRDVQRGEQVVRVFHEERRGTRRFDQVPEPPANARPRAPHWQSPTPWPHPCPSK